MVLSGLLIHQVYAAADVVLTATVYECCPSPVAASVTNTMNCYGDGKPIAECLRLLDPNFHYHITVTTRHASNCTSMIKSDVGSNAFYYSSSTDPTRNVLTTTYFDNIETMQKRPPM